jgi:putative peptidoglycan lipid II flippase
MTVAGWLVVTAADLALVHGATGETVAARLAMGQSLGLTIAGVGTLIAVRRVTGRHVYDGFSRALAVGLAAAAFAALAGRVVAGAIGAGAVGPSIGAAVVSALVVALVFVAVVVVLDRPDLRMLLRGVGRRG